MLKDFSKRRTLHLPVTLSVVLMTLNVVLMVIWIVLLAQDHFISALTIGTIASALSLFGLSFYLFLTVKEIQLNRRQSNFVDSVTHELKTPIASLRLYLDTLRLRHLDDEQRDSFYRVMEADLGRLDRLISELLEVGRLDAICQQSESESVALEPLLRHCAEVAVAYHKDAGPVAVTFDIEPVVLAARRLVLELIFRNLFDNAVKYAGAEPWVHCQVRAADRGRVIVRIRDNGAGVPPEIRKKIFRIFFRGGNELHRTKKGTGLGLYIVHTLVKQLKGRIGIHDPQDGPGAVFEVELPGAAAVPEGHNESSSLPKRPPTDLPSAPEPVRTGH